MSLLSFYEHGSCSDHTQIDSTWVEPTHPHLSRCSSHLEILVQGESGRGRRSKPALLGDILVHHF
eukprot:scaffold37112_cov35-Tisochrysis_lutea.AAC.4